MSQTVALTAIRSLTHDVREYTTEKPRGYSFTPGQATDVALLKDGWRDEARPFTFTSLPDDDVLRFTIKTYPSHDGVTEQLGAAGAGDALSIGEPWGAITDKGPGYFIAGGAGITPFLAILRDRQRRDALAGCHLIFSNQTPADIICHEELENMRGLATTFVITDAATTQYPTGKIDRAFLLDHVKNFETNFYICGPDGMVKDLTATLKDLGADPDGITFEQ